jgi:hypothetical protein
MKYLILFEKYDIIEHLKDRGIDVNKTRVIIDQENQDSYFFLYNLSGQMIGYQKYNPNYEKTSLIPKMAKYFTWVSSEDKGKKIAVWGLESTNFMDEFIFVVEGIFDAARIQEAGFPAIAVLCNDPNESMKSWLATLPQIKIVIYDNDKAGMELKKVGDHSYTVPSGKDMNDLTPKEAKIFLKECLLNSGIEL